eukprot:m.143565 g.143565  ORF g.143565 m.143565 type:complete len:186 (-) comp16020_c2_seq1:39-596(-)
MSSELQLAAKHIFQQGIDAVRPQHLLHHAVTIQEHKSQGEVVLRCKAKEKHVERSMKVGSRLWIFGFGKAVLAMAESLHELLSPHLELQGQVHVPIGTSLEGANVGDIALRACGKNNLPDQSSVNATSEMLQKIDAIPEGEPVILLISGGGSALLVQLEDDIDLDEYHTLVKTLSHKGASIEVGY